MTAPPLALMDYVGASGVYLSGGFASSFGCVIFDGCARRLQLRRVVVPALLVALGGGVVRFIIELVARYRVTGGLLGRVFIDHRFQIVGMFVYWSAHGSPPSRSRSREDVAMRVPAVQSPFAVPGVVRLERRCQRAVKNAK
jgi:hypothetical protein